ncbi:hypothetical protein HK102_011803, partial [Quaeritorhiza haematococci]
MSHPQTTNLADTLRSTTILNSYLVIPPTSDNSGSESTIYSQIATPAGSSGDAVYTFPPPPQKSTSHPNRSQTRAVGFDQSNTSDKERMLMPPPPLRAPPPQHLQQQNQQQGGGQHQQQQETQPFGNTPQVEYFGTMSSMFDSNFFGAGGGAVLGTRGSGTSSGLIRPPVPPFVSAPAPLPASSLLPMADVVLSTSTIGEFSTDSAVGDDKTEQGTKAKAVMSKTLEEFRIENEQLKQTIDLLTTRVASLER